MKLRKGTVVAVIAVVGSFWISGCAIEAARRADVAYKAQRSLLGMREAEVRACAGPPSGEQRLGGRVYLTYAVSPEDNPGGRVSCTATFSFRGDELTDLRYTNGNGNMIKKREDCYQVIRDCVETEGDRSKSGFKIF